MVCLVILSHPEMASREFCNPNPNDEEPRAKGETVLLPPSPPHSMESLNLNALAGSLPTSNLANAEKELLNNFRGISLFFVALSRSPYGD